MWKPCARRYGESTDPTAKREAVTMMLKATTISARRARRLVGLSRTVLEYEPKADSSNSALEHRLVELAHERGRMSRLHWRPSASRAQYHGKRDGVSISGRTRRLGICQSRSACARDGQLVRAACALTAHVGEFDCRSASTAPQSSESGRACIAIE